MNKDLDDRLIPNGEYRDAINISVGKSEADDIGALETVLGNTKITNSDLLVTQASAAGTTFLTDTGTVNPSTSGLAIFTGNYENAASPIINIAPQMSVHKVVNGNPGSELALVGSSSYNTSITGKTVVRTSPFSSAVGDVYQFSGDFASQTATTDATLYAKGNTVYITLLSNPATYNGSLYVGMQIYIGINKVGEITGLPAFAWPNDVITSVTCSLTQDIPASSSLTFKAGSIFLSGDYSSSIERGMDAEVVSGFAQGNIVTVIKSSYDANSGTTQVVYDASSNSNHLGTKSNLIKFYWPLEAIGFTTDEANGIIYTFLTDNNSAIGSYAPATGLGSHHYVTKFTPDGNGGGSYDAILTGSFLNFSKQNPISGVNLIENLLFWTDNRNQPRKINVSQSLGYYTKENQISVAKYNPYLPISLLDITTSTAGATSAATTITLSANNSSIAKGMSVIGPSISATDYIYVKAINGTSITINANASVTDGDELTFLTTTMTGSSISNYFNDVEMPATTNWPGDPDYLEGRFVRFSYRFEFDDGEYSLMAPFTQAAFIPKQRGYFMNGDEDSSYRSTIVDFMENGVQNVNLKIPLPDRAYELKQGTNYKISNIEILYKESDQISVKILDSLAISDILSGFTAQSPGINEYTYNYQSRKPIRTLPQAQTVRVYDKVPVKALAQETSGNRIIYGNFQSQHTAPSTINYFVTSGDKNITTQTNWAEYPNHSLKQNRNYQVGFVLSDKYGRTSPVILSSVTTSGVNTGGIQYGGSTVYTAYDSTASDIRNWFGDALQVVIEDTITQTETPQGAPGLYAETIGIGYNTFQSATNLQPTISGNQYTFNIYSSTTATTGANFSPTTNIVISPGNTDIAIGQTVVGGTIPTNTKVISIDNSLKFNVDKSVTGLSSSTALTFYDLSTLPVVGSFLRGQYIDFTKITNVDISALPLVTVTTEYPINPDLYLQSELQSPDTKYAYTLGTDSGFNATGWYSYKVVVRQQEQDYYNVYLPGILSGYPDQTGTPPPFPSDPTGATANVVLINDNINKVPRDLQEVGPDQKQFRSSVQLFGRVSNNGASTNIQYYPGILTDTAVSISTADDSNMDFDTLGTNGKLNLYQIDTNPLVARLSTNKNNIIGDSTATMRPFLAVYETEPVESALDIFWETTQSGLIADLNADILNGFDGAANLSAMSPDLTEAKTSGDFITAYFYPVNNQGAELPQDPNNPATMVVKDGTTPTANTINIFELVPETTQGVNYGRYRIRIKAASSNVPYVNNSSIINNYQFTFTVTYGTDPAATIIKNIAMTNVQPSFDDGNSFPNVIAAGNLTDVVRREARNGSSNTGNNQSGLFYSLDSATVSAGYFSIDQNGDISKLTTTPIGNYSMTVRVDDAYSSSANPVLGVGTLFKEVVQTVTVGPQPLNGGTYSFSSCIQQAVPGMLSGKWITSEIVGSGNGINAAWYIADGTFTSSTPASGYAITNLPPPCNTNLSPNTSSSVNLHKLGAAVTSGTVLFSCSMQQRYSNTAFGQTFTSGFVSGWRVYWRADSSGTFGPVTDTNNYNISAQQSMTTNNGTFGSEVYNQVVFAFNTPGEYCVVASDARTGTASIAADRMTAWVNVSDLNYSTCVIQNGSIVSGLPKSFSYYLSGATQTPYNCGSGNTVKYATHPYANYVESFYNENTLSTVYTPTQAEFYTFRTNPATSPAEPFSIAPTQTIVSAKFNTSGVKISGDANTCNDKYARWCNSTTTCAHPYVQSYV